ncbi:hypothetical protein [uncultured Brevundimonas sp.]|uniref:hypothetical protein n=1 Tax=uncultured Brevundimonas sp. TaxID=213418 RepID=UPI0030EB17AD|tara:strand:- start:233 stop:559 length:327 start_codon:yes stop_codon:yes gene_type:complete
MKTGLYAAHFITAQGSGAGVVNLSENRLRGGDAALYYIGDYTLDGESFRATVRTARHTQIEDIESVFGVDEVEIHLNGKWTGNMITAEGTSPQAPGVRFQAHLKWLSD